MDARRRHDRTGCDRAVAKTLPAPARRPNRVRRVRDSGVGWQPSSKATRQCESSHAVLHEGARVSHDSTVDHAVVGRHTVVKPDVVLSAQTIVGADVTSGIGHRLRRVGTRPSGVASSP